MAFRFPFFKSKKPAEAPASPPPAAPDVPPPPPPPAPEIAQKIVPRQGNLAAALRAATATVGGGASPAQSAIFKPKVSIVLKPEASAAPAPPPPAPVMAEVVAAPELSPLPDTPATIEIPMAEILHLLPENVFKPGAAEGASLPDMISLSTSEILPQLPKGRVQVPLGTILAAFPPDLIDTSVADSSNLKIKIPLHLIIPRLPESVMSLPRDQVKQQVDASIEVPFSERRARPATPPATPDVPKGTSVEELLAPAAVPVPDTPPAPPLSPLHEILGISDGRELRIPEIAEQIRVRFNLLGVMIATEDGLPMAGSLPSDLDSNAWCGLGHLLFQRFSKNGGATRTEPRRCMLSFGTFWLTIWQDHGIYLLFVHQLETVTAEFEQRGAVLAREVALQCQQQNKTS